MCDYFFCNQITGCVDWLIDGMISNQKGLDGNAAEIFFSIINKAECGNNVLVINNYVTEVCNK